MLDLYRLLRIGFAVWGFLLWLLLRRLRLWPASVPPGRKACLTLQRLGTTFIKVGQSLSLRPDLLPDEYLREFQVLQDQVASFPAADAEREIEASFGRPVAQLFREFDQTPLAAASVAQVHRARLPDGTAVIVKVRRPGIKAQVHRDMRLLRRVLRVAVFFAPGWRRFRPLDLVDEIETNLSKELDFRQEARNIQRFANAFAGSSAIFIPPVIGELFAEAVLVQAMSGGQHVSDAGGRTDGPRLAEAFVDAYIHQFFVLGLFHADPHPGNLFIRDDGRICFHDFGLVGFLDRATRHNLAGFMQAFVHQDSSWLLDAYLDLGILAGKIERSEFQRGLEEMLLDYAGRPLKEWSFGEAMLRVIRLGSGQNIRLPHHLLLLMRTFFIMESTVRSLDPEFNMQERLAHKTEQVLQEVAQDQGWRSIAARLKYEAAVTLQDMPHTLSALARSLRSEGIEVPLRHHGFEEFQHHAERGANRLALALVSLGLYVASSLLTQRAAGPTVGGSHCSRRLATAWRCG